MRIILTAIALLLLWGVGSVLAYADEASSGFVLTVGDSKTNDHFNGEIMFEGGLTESVSGGVAVSLFASEQERLYGGLNVLIRAHLSGAVAPFVGAGVFAGSWASYEAADGDGRDNDGDGFVDEKGEVVEEGENLIAVYPELGLHIRVSELVRLTGSYRYYYSSSGRKSDRELYALGIGVIF